ncbi:MAG: hypothetical protein KGL39_02830 [Patescibacteria group bacterium]|nr:hypothetical protein [Patescibacteria group bacterium]
MNEENKTLEPGLDILSIGFGDIKIKFDEKDPQEAARAAQIIKDMLRRGYALFVHLPDGSLQRVLEFKADTGEYVIACGPDIELVPGVVPTPMKSPEDKSLEAPPITGGLKRFPEPTPEPAEFNEEKNVDGGRKGRKIAVKMTKAKATMVGRSAGG